MTDYRKLIDDLWGYAETGFEEYHSAETMCTFLEKEGFQVTRNIAHMETAFEAVYGTGKPVICFLAEYDALSGMNQKADVTHYEPVTCASDNGHGCGHHLLGTGAIRAAVQYRNYLKENSLPGTVKLVGCPAEETGSGKAYLARDGYFDDCDIALTWHPSVYNMVSTGSSQSCIACFFKFHGVSAHAAGSPHLGRSALDACELMNVGVNYLREHMEPTDRVHYAYIDAGGKAPNVVQSEAVLKYFVRSATNPKCMDLYQRVIDCAKGAALMTGTTVDIIFDEGLSNLVPNFTLEDVLAESFRKLYHPCFTQKQLDYAQSFKDTFDTEQSISCIPYPVKDRQSVIDSIRKHPINDFFVETFHSDVCEMGSTDVGDVSWVVPTAQINTACYSYGADAHSWQWVAQGKSETAMQASLLAGDILCDAAKTLYHNPHIIEEAKSELKQRLQGHTYQCLIPADIMPHISKAE